MKILRGKIIVEYVGTKSDPYDWSIVEPVIVELSNGDTMKISIGFVTDFASVPRRLWSFVAPIGCYNIASLIHDYIYTKHNYSRSFADNEFLLWLNLLSPKNRVRNKVMYYSVKLLGNKRFEKYAV